MLGVMGKGVTVSPCSTHPDLRRQWAQETEYSRLLFDRFLDHNRDAERHERLAELNDTFTFRCNSHRRNGQMRFLQN